jgi:hypothetical protein
MSDNDSITEEQEMEEVIVLVEGSITESYGDDDYTDTNSDFIDSINDDPILVNMRNQVENIYLQECEFLDIEKTNQKYYVGLCAILGKKRIILDIAIQPQTFLQFDSEIVLNYLSEYSVFPVQRQILDTRNIHIQIMKLNIEPRTKWYNVILKTFWIKIIQRTWKRVFRERQEALLKRRTLKNMRHFETRGRHLPGIHVLPGLYGMLR